MVVKLQKKWLTSEWDDDRDVLTVYWSPGIDDLSTCSKTSPADVWWKQNYIKHLNNYKNKLLFF